eukprot:scpid84681/ scgid23561/ 
MDVVRLRALGSLMKESSNALDTFNKLFKKNEKLGPSGVYTNAVVFDAYRTEGKDITRSKTSMVRSEEQLHLDSLQNQHRVECHSELTEVVVQATGKQPVVPRWTIASPPTASTMKGNAIDVRSDGFVFVYLTAVLLYSPADWTTPATATVLNLDTGGAQEHFHFKKNG